MSNHSPAAHSVSRQRLPVPKAHNGAGLALAFVLAGITLVGGPAVLANAFDSPTPVAPVAAAPSSPTESPTSPVSPTPSVVPNDTYAAAQDLYFAAVAAGLPAGSWAPDPNPKAHSTSSGTDGSDEGMYFMVYTNRETLLSDINAAHLGDNPEAVLVGPNWMLIGDGTEPLITKLGGVHPTWAAKTPTQKPASKPAPKPAPTQPPKPKPTQAPKPKPKPKPQPTITAEQEQAIGTAEDYLDSGQHFSKSGLIDQLKYEGYSRKNATFAVNHIQVSWKAQAAGAAEDYLNSGQHFSRSGLIEQLEYEGFTHSQAVYGVRKAGL